MDIERREAAQRLREIRPCKSGHIEWWEIARALGLKQPADWFGWEKFEPDSVNRLADLIDPGEDVSMSAYDLLPEEDREALRWVNEHGGIDAVQKEVSNYTALCRSIQDADNRRAELCSALGIDSDTGWSDAMAEMLRRLMPEGMGWPRFEDGEPVRIGDDFEDLGQVAGIKFGAGGVTIEGTAGNSDLFITSDERVKRPAPTVLAADGELCGMVARGEIDAFIRERTGKPVDRDALLALVDEMDMDASCYAYVDDYNVNVYARRIREALGE